jgi:L-2-hydroxyglutarate oxidase LhgO
MSKPIHTTSSEFNFSLIGAGIMSATLAVLIKELMPEAKISIYERMNVVAAESSNAWNNAGTGHSAYCELNYTPQKEDGSIDVSKALKSLVNLMSPRNSGATSCVLAIFFRMVLL